MPCMFRKPDVMIIHASLVSQHLYKLASEQDVDQDVDGSHNKVVVPRKGKVLPYVLVGDFNAQPESSVYDLMTSGTISSKSSAQFGAALPGDSW